MKLNIFSKNMSMPVSNPGSNDGSTTTKKRTKRNADQLLLVSGGAGGRPGKDAYASSWDLNVSESKKQKLNDEQEPISSLTGNRVLDVQQIVQNIKKHTVCRACSENQTKKATVERQRDLESFFDFVEDYENGLIRSWATVTTSNCRVFSRKGIRQLHCEYLQKKADAAKANMKSTSKRSTTATKKANVNAASVSVEPTKEAGQLGILEPFENTMGLATTIQCKCCTDKTHTFYLHEPETTSHATNKVQHEAAKWYAINVKFVYSMHILGCGNVDAGKILGMMDLPWQGWAKNTFRRVEKHAGLAERVMCDLAIESALQDEIKATLEKEGKLSYKEWLAMSNEEKDANKPKLTVSYDMGWQMRSSGRKYASNSGHGFIVGGLTKQVIGMVVYSKLCRVCLEAEKKKVPPAEHDCQKNFEGSSKSMEASAILKLVTDAHKKRRFIVHVIISDDDSTMQAHLTHPRLKKNNKPYADSKGKLSTRIPAPMFLADPTHRVKCVAKAIYALVSLKGGAGCGCTKGTALRMKINWGYMLKQNREKTLADMKRACKAPVEHMFNNHEFCSSQWCMKLRAKEEKKTYVEKEGEFHCKEKEKGLYNLILKSVSKYQQDNRLLESLHPFDTQTNEAINNQIAYVVPKNKTFSASDSLLNRISTVAGTNVFGFEDYWTNVFEMQDMHLSSNFKTFLRSESDRKKYNQIYRRRFDVKRLRRHHKKAAIKQQLYEDALARKTGADYGAGIRFESKINTLELTNLSDAGVITEDCDDSSAAKKATTATSTYSSSAADATTQKRCPRCHSTTHLRSSSGQCPVGNASKTAIKAAIARGETKEVAKKAGGEAAKELQARLQVASNRVQVLVPGNVPPGTSSTCTSTDI